jgi:hypothetical protein
MAPSRHFPAKFAQGHLASGCDFERIDIRKSDPADQDAETDFVKNFEEESLEKLSAATIGER